MKSKTLKHKLLLRTTKVIDHANIGKAAARYLHAVEANNEK